MWTRQASHVITIFINGATPHPERPKPMTNPTDPRNILSASIGDRAVITYRNGAGNLKVELVEVTSQTADGYLNARLVLKSGRLGHRACWFATAGEAVTVVWAASAAYTLLGAEV